MTGRRPQTGGRETAGGSGRKLGTAPVRVGNDREERKKKKRPMTNVQ
jgi:hypothetical protein